MQHMITYVVRALMSEATASLPAKTDDGDAGESASQQAKRAKTDSRSASKFRGPLLLPQFDDWLITNYHMTMIGDRKTRVSHPYSQTTEDPNWQNSAACNAITLA